ncbi:hypothetical protein F7Q99_22905 [Streptomyces kaniharaensis]|uniref:Uncharacterized protein n=1 Tax=Streptomyces kaniharaensis TaxID=212423 RepID=A0A6N7KYJ1_9ACTN|nr:hypothetical protein [Streptomyces kaniharaensis]MQS15034.1 hypothetical protein [Streptomyces kaniharaensis]
MKGIVSKVAIGVAGTGMAVAVATVAVGPRVSEWYDGRHQVQASYATGGEAKADRRSMPAWLPDNASSVRYMMSTTGDDRLLRAVLPEGRLPAGCTAGLPGKAVHRVPASLRAGWFPEGVATKASGTCGHYNVTLHGHQLYAWQDGAAVQAALRAERPAKH